MSNCRRPLDVNLLPVSCSRSSPFPRVQIAWRRLANAALTTLRNQRSGFRRDRQDKDRRHVQSHIATILVADAVGYCKAMGQNEEAALAALTTSRHVIDCVIAGNCGRIFAAAGDSVLAEFAGADQAVSCGIAIQRALARVRRDDDRAVLTYRIGIHRGRVFAGDHGLLGDAVNIAARIESLADPGGLSISGLVRDELTTSDRLELEDLGPQILKNIDRAIRIVRVRLGEPDCDQHERGSHSVKFATGRDR